MVDLKHGDCLELMKDIPDGSVDMILADLPYGTTRCKWDTQIDLTKLWEQYKRIIKKRGCIALFAQTPFDKILGASNIDMLKYEWIWEKPIGTGFLNSSFAPLKCHENILIFAKSSAGFVRDKNKSMVYNPQFTTGVPYTIKTRSISNVYDKNNMVNIETKSDGLRYPRDILKYRNDKTKLIPTQKPVPLLEYLIKTYTNHGDVVLDNCMGSGSTGIACLNTGRNFIGIEKDDKYFDIAKTRIETHEASLFSA